jgi:sugar phosphate isomerase/epimerase
VELKLFRHLWGLDEPWESAFPKIKAAGYAGIESGLPDPGDEARFRELLAAHQLGFIAQIFTAGSDVPAHVQSFGDQLGRAVTFDPVLVNCHGGRDAWTAAEGQQFYAAVLAVEREAPAAVAHETHRGRILYNPWITRDLLHRFPDLRLSCDFSHWVCVCERLLTSEEEIVALAAARCLHLHARVGYEEGPQVPDPRMQQFAPHLAAHEAWWDLVWDSQAARGMAVSTLTPEFGPPLYQHTLPPSGAPVGDLAAICDWQAARQAQRFANR